MSRCCAFLVTAMKNLTLGLFPKVVDLSKANPAEREQRTLEEVKNESPVIYQGGLRTKARLKDVDCEIVGEPDFLIYESSNYVIRDSKMSRRIIEKDHRRTIRSSSLSMPIYSFSGEGEMEPIPTRLCKSAGAIRFQSGECGLRSISVTFDVSTLSTFQRRPVVNRGNISNYLGQRSKTCTPRWLHRSGCPIRPSHSMHDTRRARCL